MAQSSPTALSGRWMESPCVPVCQERQALCRLKPCFRLEEPHSVYTPVSELNREPPWGPGSSLPVSQAPGTQQVLSKCWWSAWRLCPGSLTTFLSSFR